MRSEGGRREAAHEPSAEDSPRAGKTLRSHRWLGVGCLLGLSLAGCEVQTAPEKAKSPGTKTVANATGTGTATDDSGDSGGQQDEAAAIRIKQRTLGNSARTVNSLNQDEVVGRLLQAVTEAAELGPVTVVWLWDLTSDAKAFNEGLREQVAAAYQQLPGEVEQRVQTAVGSFATEVSWPLAEPTSDLTTVLATLEALEFNADGGQWTFAALQQAFERYRDVRRRERRQLFFVCCTNEAGADRDDLEAAVAALRQTGAPLYVLGLPAPFGRVGNEAVTAMHRGGRETPVGLQVGPETAIAQRIALEFPPATAETEWLDSGFGSWGLERLTRQTGGRYLIVRDAIPLASGRLRRSNWPRSSAPRFPVTAMADYKPDYRAAEVIRKEVAESPLRQSLQAAAKLPRAAVLSNPGLVFDARNTARMVNSITRSQREPARVLRPLEQLLTILQAGEEGRERETERRWQAAFDLALGRTLAAHTRADGYNTLLAELKRGKTFEQPASDTWELVPAESFASGGSTLKRNAKRAIELLQRVQREHPNTPWAYLAAEELKTPVAWRWEEHDRHPPE